MTVVEKPPAAPRAPARRKWPMSQIVGGGILVLIGLLWLLERTDIIDISVTSVLALATLVTGLSLMLLARDGAHGSLIVLGTILAIVTLLTAAAPFEGFQGGVGDRTIELTSVDDIAANYNLAVGKLTIDLREIDDLRPGTKLDASVGMGELIVRVPEGIVLSVNARIGAGELEILGRARDGIGIDETYSSPNTSDGSGSFILELEMLAGHVEVIDE